MIRHVVMWKIKDVSESEKQAMKNDIITALKSLPGKIDFIKELSVRTNAKDASIGNYDVMLDTAFQSMNELNDYQKHPEHLKVGEIIKARVKERACIDFEY